MSAALRRQGQGVGRGFATGPAYVFAQPPPPLTGGRPSQRESDHLLAAIGDAIAVLEALMGRVDAQGAAILEFQVEMLRDPVIHEMAAADIGRGLGAALAWATALEGYIAGFEQADDDDVRARAIDVIDIRDRVLRHLEGLPSADFATGAVYVGRDMAPSLFLAHDWSGGGGIVLEAGSTASHVALLAGARGVPMIVGVGALAVSAGTPVLVDGRRGLAIADPDRDDLQAAADGDGSAAETPAAAVWRAGTISADVEILVNISDLSEIGRLDPGLCDGIGLARSEFLLPSAADLVDENKQFRLYCELVDWAAGRPVTVRLLDLGGDKPLGGNIADDRNPFLGLRGIRLLLARPELLRIQVRALLRAAVSGRLKVLLPMVTAPAEVEATRRIFLAEATDLARRQVAVAMPAIGIMVEVPAAALMLDTFGSADFFSVGSNDLAQYLTASARDNPDVSDLYRQAGPALLRLITDCVGTAGRMGRPIGLCGDMAGDPVGLPSLIATGLRQISVAPRQLAPIKASLAQAGIDS